MTAFREALSLTQAEAGGAAELQVRLLGSVSTAGAVGHAELTLEKAQSPGGCGVHGGPASSDCPAGEGRCSPQQDHEHQEGCRGPCQIGSVRQKRGSRGRDGVSDNGGRAMQPFERGRRKAVHAHQRRQRHHCAGQDCCSRRALCRRYHVRAYGPQNRNTSHAESVGGRRSLVTRPGADSADSQGRRSPP